MQEKIPYMYAVRIGISEPQNMTNITIYQNVYKPPERNVENDGDD
jgi:hypothetical protein